MVLNSFLRSIDNRQKIVEGSIAGSKATIAETSTVIERRCFFITASSLYYIHTKDDANAPLVSQLCPVTVTIIK